MKKEYRKVTLDLSNANTFNPLEALFASDEILVLKNKHNLELNDNLMVNPQTFCDM